MERARRESQGCWGVGSCRWFGGSSGGPSAITAFGPALIGERPHSLVAQISFSTFHYKCLPFKTGRTGSKVFTSWCTYLLITPYDDALYIAIGTHYSGIPNLHTCMRVGK